MNIQISFDHPYFDEETILAMTLQDLDCFYGAENEVNRLNLFFMLEASLHKFQAANRREAAARCAFFMAYYLFIALTPPASCELAAFYIDQALDLDDTPEYRQWQKSIAEGN